MKTNQHTPGPWTHTGHGTIRGRNFELICEVKAHDHRGEILNANSSLIAAAPIMLQALYRAFEQLNGTEAGNQIAAAIAKAEGRE
jgi:hypothetical protein